MSPGTSLPLTVHGGRVTFTIDAKVGRLLVEAPGHLPSVIRESLQQATGPGEPVACATPPTVLSLPPATPDELASGPCVRIAGYWHDSLIEGPGRRSTAKFQGCPLHCRGCITPESWDPAGGYLVPAERLAGTLLDPSHERDGVTILGGEPFAQSGGLLALVHALRQRECAHILVYTGYTFERLRRLAVEQPTVGIVLDEIDILIDSPFVAARAADSGPWIGSSNQRVIDLAATRRLCHLVLLDAPTHDSSRPGRHRSESRHPAAAARTRLATAQGPQ
jgi:anaerobic ribonucleoside-triphosphate reductase activating protein